jgi:hypothetical protein
MTDDRKPVPESDYLWDRSGAPDAETARLESLMAELRQEVPPPPVPFIEENKRFDWLRSWWAATTMPRFAMAAAVMVLIFGALLILGPLRMGRGYAVVRLDGTPRVGNQHITNGGGELGVGQVIETDAASRAEIRVGLIGEVELEPNSRMRLLRARTTEHRLALDRGTMHARIWAPPRLFFVETPSALAIDLGCEYTLNVEDSGAGLLRVDSGWVQLEFGGREAVVPAGAAAATRPGFGPGTPYWWEASPELISALALVDFGTAEQRLEALPRVLGAARDDDAITLLTLLNRLDATGRTQVYDRLAQLLPPPKGVTREGVVAGDQRMIDRWWELLDIGYPKN